MVRGFGSAPRWAWVAMAVSAVAFVVLSFVAANRTQPPASAAPAATDAPEAEPVRILVIGDSYTGGSDEGGTGAAGWPKLVEAGLVGAGQDVTVDVSAAGGSGYVAVGPGGKSLVQLAQEVTGTYDLVVFFGSRNDVAGSDAVQAAAEQALDAIRATSPDATLLVIGPPWVNDDPPAGVLNASVGVENAAATAGATFVDPLADRWFHDRPELIGADGVHPTDEGHRYMADMIRPHMQAALDSLGA